MDQEPEQTQSSSTEDETEARPDKVQQPSKAPRKIAPLLASFPTAMMKFTSFKKHKMPVSSNATKLPDVKKDASLEGPFGLGPLVFPNLQRFNNIKFFLTLYCMVVLAQGELEEQGCSGVLRSEVDKADTHGRKERVRDQA